MTRAIRRPAGLAMMVCAFAAATGSAQGASLGAGCAPSRPAVAHYAGGQIVPAPQKRVPCATETGFYTGETGIGVSPNGTVWFSAADWEWALVRSRDNGAHWERFTVPGPQAMPGCGVGTSAFSVPCSDSESDKYNTVGDAFLLVDRDSNRLFWSKTYGYAICSSLNYSPDDGANWRAVPRFACPGGASGKMPSGPPPKGGEQPAGTFKNVVYECVNGPVPTFVVGPARTCQKSLDGGQTWSNAGLPVVPSPQAPGCLHFQEPQVVGRDGTVYMPLGCGASAVMVAISHDEARTWSYVTVPIGDSGSSAGLIGGVSAAVDDAGTLYVVWPGADNKVYLATTKDEGRTWTGPLLVSAPGVMPASEPHAQVAAREPGHIAIAYYGSTGSDTETLNGYLTESFDAGAAKPLLYSATLNDPAKPLYFPVEDDGTPPRNDYLGVTIAPDGTPWTALVKLKSSKPDDEGYIQSTGFAGRLVTP